MKKILALILSVLMVVTACAGLMTVFAEDGGPVYLIDGFALNPVGGNQVHGEYSYEDGYIYLEASDSDPWYWLVGNGVGATVGRYMVIKYRTECAGMVGGMFTSSDLFGSGGHYVQFNFDYPVTDGSWSHVIVDLEEKLGDNYDETTNYIGHLRFDFTDGDTAAAGQWLDIEYIAFFDSESDAEDFEHVLPEDPEAAFGGCYKTLDFGGTAEEVAALFDPNNKIDVTYEAGLGYTTFTSTGTDPYLRFWDSNDNQGDFGVVGYEAAYILVKYRTQANSQNKTEIGFFTNCGDIWWGADGSCVKAELVVNPAEGEGADAWHYVVVDASTAWGAKTDPLWAFRLDPLSEAVPGETIDIAEIKFFSKETWVKNYITNLAQTGDAAATELMMERWCEHTTTEVVPTVEPTCTVSGFMSGIRCTFCRGYVEGGTVIPATGHSYGNWTVTKEPTCAENGTKIGTCLTCGHETIETISATSHSYGEWTVTKEPTCTEVGVKAVVCLECGEAKTTTIPVIAHAYGEWVTVHEPTCTASGVAMQTCLACGYEKTRTVYATGHYYGSWTVMQEATCTTEGWEVIACQTCGFESTATIPALGHTFDNWFTILKPTCTNEGKETVFCSVCGHQGITRSIQPTHSYGDWTTMKEPTCTTDGLKMRTCTCGATETVTIPATGHILGAWITTQEPTCTVTGEKTRSCACGEVVKTEIIYATGHSFGDWAVTRELTCTVNGVKTRTCTACDEVQTQVTYAQGHKIGDPVTIVAPTCTETGVSNLPCMVCKATLLTAVTPATGHTFGEWTVTTDCTCTADGERERVCACGEKETEVIKAEGHTLGETDACVVCGAGSYVLGDANGDGRVSASDLTRLKKHLAGNGEVALYEAADVTGDGKINAMDVTRFKRYLSGEASLG